jgi:hypothetical protein
VGPADRALEATARRTDKVITRQTKVELLNVAFQMDRQERSQIIKMVGPGWIPGESVRWGEEEGRRSGELKDCAVLKRAESRCGRFSKNVPKATHLQGQGHSKVTFTRRTCPNPHSRERDTLKGPPFLQTAAAKYRAELTARQTRREQKRSITIHRDVHEACPTDCASQVS